MTNEHIAYLGYFALVAVLAVAVIAYFTMAHLAARDKVPPAPKSNCEDEKKEIVKELPDSAKTLRPEAMLEEYKTLRQEILNHQQNSHQITVLGLTLGGAIVSFIGLGNIGLGKGPDVSPLTKAIPLFAVVLIFYSLLHAQCHRRRKMYNIGRYIELVIETQMPGLYWETAWDRASKGDSAEASSVLETLPLLVLQAIAFVGSLWFFYDAWSTLPLKLFGLTFWGLVHSGLVLWEVTLLLAVAVYVIIFRLEVYDVRIRATDVRSLRGLYQNKRTAFKDEKKKNQEWFSTGKGLGDDKPASECQSSDEDIAATSAQGEDISQ